MLLLAILACAPDEKDEGLTCGAGTHEEDGACVADEADADTDADSDTDTDADSDTDTDTDTDTDSDTDTDVEPAARWSGETRLPGAAWSLPGDRASDLAGNVAVGDANGDGQPDLLVGGPMATRDAEAAGAAWLVLGPITSDRPLAEADALLVGDTERAYAGMAVAFAGDLDGDGDDELVVGAPTSLYMGGGAGPGSVHIVRGPVSGESSLGDADAIWVGEGFEEGAGRGFVGGVDFTGDGLPDLVTNAMQWNLGRGAVYLLGTSALDGGPLDEADVRIYNLDDRTGGFGKQVAALGDLDGDGFEELGVGWNEWFIEDVGYVGAVAIFLGPVDSSRSSEDADAFVIGHETRGQIGAYTNATAGVGDVDGDGVGDVMIGSPEASVDDKTEAGMAWLVSGADAVDGAEVFFALATFEGFSNSGYLGQSVTRVGDLDGDGRAEVALAEIGRSAYAGYGGATCLWYGSVSGTRGCADADAVWHGDSERGHAGIGLLGGMDLTGDALPDLVIGADQATGDSAASGIVYVVPGLAP